MESQNLSESISVESLTRRIDAGKQQITLSDSVCKTFDGLSKQRSSSVVVNDEYGNKLLGIGADDKIKDYDYETMSNDTLNWMLWTSLYNDSWVFKRAIDKPAQDEVRCGITLHLESEHLDEINRLVKRHRTDFIKLLQWGALFGGAVGVVMLDNVDDNDYAKPIDVSKLKSAKSIRLYVTDRWYGCRASTDTVDDMNSIDFGKPKYYDISFPDNSTIRFHHDYVLRYEHRIAPNFIKNGLLQGWGYAEGSHIINELMRDDKLKASVQSLIDKSLIEVIKMSGMRGVFMGQDPAQNEQLRKRLEMVNWGRNFNSLTFLDSDDDYQEHGFSGLTGLSDILQQNMWLISSALEMQGVLFGDLKGGLSDDNDALERYDETINNRCETYYRPVLEKFLGILFKKFDITDKVDFDFNSLLINKQDKDRLESMRDFTDLLSKMLGDGVIGVAEYAKSVQAYVTKGVIDFGLTDEVIKRIEQEANESSEDLDKIEV